MAGLGNLTFLEKIEYRRLGRRIWRATVTGGRRRAFTAVCGDIELSQKLEIHKDTGDAILITVFVAEVNLHPAIVSKLCTYDDTRFYLPGMSRFAKGDWRSVFELATSKTGFLKTRVEYDMMFGTDFCDPGADPDSSVDFGPTEDTAARVREKEISAKKLYRYIWLVRKKNTGNGVGDTMTTLKAEGLGRPVPAEQPPGSAMRPNESAAEFFCREMLKTVQHC